MAQSIFQALHVPSPLPIPLYYDNKAAQHIAQNPASMGKPSGFMLTIITPDTRP